MPISEKNFGRKLMEVEKKQKHFILVHGLGQGAWTWHKLIPLLKSAGHRVTALDMAASGVNGRAIQDVRSFYEYSESLMEAMESVPQGEKVILVGHSLGGLNIALAMEKFPQKISVSVFVAAFLPDTVHSLSYVLDQHKERTPEEIWLDSQFEVHGRSEQPSVFVLTGEDFLALNAYQLSPEEEVALAKIMRRPGSLFQSDLSKIKLTHEGFRSVTQVYVLCTEDRLIPKEFQKWMIENSKINDVMEIEGSDHMPMASKPQELCSCLLKIADKYS